MPLAIFTDPTPLIIWTPMTFIGLYYLSTARTTRNEKNNLSRYVEVDSIRSVPFGIPIIVHGQVKKIQNSLIGPASGKECVYYQVEIQEFVETKKNGEEKTSRWLNTSTSGDSIPFLIEDESGELEVNPNNAEIHPTHRFENYTTKEIDRSDPHLPAEKSYLADISFQDRPTGQMRLIEESILVDDPVNIFGVVELQNGRKVIQENKEYAMFITDKTREQQTQQQVTQITFNFLLGILLSVIGIVNIIFTLISVDWSQYIPIW